MKYSETDPELRRIPIYLEDTAGSPVSGEAVAGAEIQVSKSGSAFVDGAGSVVEVGNGAYYYEATQAETETDSFLMVKVVVSTAGVKPFMSAVDIGRRILLNEPTAAARRVPIYLEDSIGNPVAALSIAGSECRISENGAAFVNCAGVVTEIGSGAYYYELPPAEVNVAGFGMLKINKAPALLFVLAWDVAVADMLVSIEAPVIDNISPIDGEVTPGVQGAFSATFRTARLTPITFDLSNVSDIISISITVRYMDRNETYVARDAEGTFVWPFDVQADNTMTPLVAGETSVSMLPRGGWPPAVVEIKVAASLMAVPA